jgi:hypothetical protein
MNEFFDDKKMNIQPSFCCDQCEKLIVADNAAKLKPLIFKHWEETHPLKPYPLGYRRRNPWKRNSIENLFESMRDGHIDWGNLLAQGQTIDIEAIQKVAWYDKFHRFLSSDSSCRTVCTFMKNHALTDLDKKELFMDMTFLFFNHVSLDRIERRPDWPIITSASLQAVVENHQEIPDGKAIVSMAREYLLEGGNNGKNDLIITFTCRNTNTCFTS